MLRLRLFFVVLLFFTFIFPVSCMLLWLWTVLQLLSDSFGSEQDASLGFAFVSLPAGVWKGLGKLCTDAARCGGCFFRSSFIYIYVRERGLLGLAVSIVQFGGVLGIGEKKGRVSNTGFQLLFKLTGL